MRAAWPARRWRPPRRAPTRAGPCNVRVEVMSAFSSQSRLVQRGRYGQPAACAESVRASNLAHAHRPHRSRRRDLGEAREFDHRADQRLQLRARGRPRRPAASPSCARRPPRRRRCACRSKCGSGRRALGDRLRLGASSPAASARVGGNRQMSSSVAWVSALIGLKARLPQSFIQISARMSERRAP